MSDGLELSYRLARHCAIDHPPPAAQLLWGGLSMLSMAEQKTAMEQHFPALECVLLEDSRAIWEGEIRPLQKAYRIRIEYFANLGYLHPSLRDEV